jgi:hypothetical protein
LPAGGNRGALLRPELPRDLAGAPAQARRLPGLPGSGGADAGEHPAQAAPPQPPRTFAPARPLLARLLRTADRGDSFRIGLFGDTGCGKTHAARQIVEAYRRGTRSNWTWIVDGKTDQGFPAYPRAADRAELAALIRRQPERFTARVVVFRGHLRRAEKPDPEEYARWVWERSFNRQARSLLVVDELREAIAPSGGQWRGGNRAVTGNGNGLRWLPLIFTEGRSPGLSIVWGTQEIQDAPRAAFNQSDELWIWRMQGLGIERLREREYISNGVDTVIPTLPDRFSPPATRGGFVRLVRGAAWDGLIYRF